MKQAITKDDLEKFIKILLLYKKIYKENQLYLIDIQLLIDKYSRYCNKEGKGCDITTEKLQSGKRIKVLNQDSAKYKQIKNEIDKLTINNAKNQLSKINDT